MIRILRQIFRTGILTEQLEPVDEAGITVAGIALEKTVMERFKRSIAIRFVDAGSCNACELEIHAINNPIYNCERFGVHFTASPRSADMLLVTGPVTRNMEIALKRTYDAMPTPKIVVAAGDCAFNGGPFGESYSTIGGVDKVIPVHAFIHGCPPTPAAILNGILRAITR